MVSLNPTPSVRAGTGRAHRGEQAPLGRDRGVEAPPQEAPEPWPRSLWPRGLCHGAPFCATIFGPTRESNREHAWPGEQPRVSPRPDPGGARAVPCLTRLATELSQNTRASYVLTPGGSRWQAASPRFLLPPSWWAPQFHEATVDSCTPSLCPCAILGKLRLREVN